MAPRGHRFGMAEGILLAILVVLALLTAYFIFYPGQAIIIQFGDYSVLQELMPALITTFVVCIIGNLIPIPTPYVFVVWLAGSSLREQNFFFPALVALVASAGCLIGELGGYGVGRGAAEISKGRDFRAIQQLQALLTRHPRLAPAIVFFFGLTPLNDDLLLVPLGFMKYSARKTIFFCWLGKLCMMLVLAYLWFPPPSGEEAWWLSMLSLYAIVIILYLMVKVDWFVMMEKVRAWFTRKAVSPKPSNGI
jgi:membrane protein YqaA with SNARE-associated domain